MTDISKPNPTAVDIFRAILDNGSALTLYSANSKTRIPMGTIHRHFKQLEKTGKIRVYESKKKGRKKIEYGPTIQGMISFYRQDKEIAKMIENYFLIWIEHKEFQKDLAAEGFNVTSESLKRSKHVFRKYMDYFAAVEGQIEKIRKGEDAISHDMQIFLGATLLSSNPQYQKLWMDLYNELPGMQKSLDEHMKNMTESYKGFKKNLKRQQHHRLKVK
ncbi:helix-turn-helix domain-containing protein [Nitrosopumilus sp.]|uniref:winged helix-turn-helix domain-containing protein n=1 Tax=Nitrosopumilus sp. TaxID=2024843 RepID=UPI00292F65AA|nr:helix-turn-helix domain-containing protein [Nitrosopumilus sp.]